MLYIILVFVIIPASIILTLEYICEENTYPKTVVFVGVLCLWLFMGIISPKKIQSEAAPIHTVETKTGRIQYIVVGKKLINITDILGVYLPENYSIRVTKSSTALGIEFLLKDKYEVVK